MSDRPTPESDKFRECIILQYMEDDCTGAGIGHLLLALTNIEQMERQRDAYAYTLRVILKSAGQHVSDAIRHTHPELAGNAAPTRPALQDSGETPPQT